MLQKTFKGRRSQEEKRCKGDGGVEKVRGKRGRGRGGSRKGEGGGRKEERDRRKEEGGVRCWQGKGRE